MKPTRTLDAAAPRRPVVRLALHATRVLAAATALAVAMILSACGASDPPAAGGACSGESSIVGSANLPKPETVANGYAEVLRASRTPA
ncbi:hypothetical protein [Nocardia asiatica]|uniref:hypothetical protein n=1 Tax=Nocardia asiatica TaxID=209252 RepID=UPI002457C03C|nr:hypothetical protein [Nocardia asiatica]